MILLRSVYENSHFDYYTICIAFAVYIPTDDYHEIIYIACIYNIRPTHNTLNCFYSQNY